MAASRVLQPPRAWGDPPFDAAGSESDGLETGPYIDNTRGAWSNRQAPVHDNCSPRNAA
jgi:hypothetical protein